MAVSQKIQTLTTMLLPAVEACGFELWGLEFFPQAKRSVLRIYIDSPEGVTVEGCSKVSHQASGILDVEDPIAGEYMLEVSSPGWDRPLFVLAHYQRFVGSEVSLRLVAPINGRRRFKGAITAVADNVVELLVEGQAIKIPFSQIDKANLVPSV
ncbi:MAG: ribosome maturation factor RimP [Moraxellaceae bacterium]|nr:ribosome maturation factor RimP [Pseudomonadales bacterium]MCP5173801.1 ribosome maturation factor RimP [Moraxellaceae bacterium]MCP5176880.1 ribosome maturation factor RimP [Moraxellaceae bacterium]HQV21783.1 ribosome maturation factor RimP [Agitococcus sp.]